ncbi:hypothetical protein ACWNZ1_24760 [Pseudomonas sp. CFBP 5748]
MNEQNQLTVIRKTAYLANYPFRALSQEVVALMERVAQGYKSPSAVLIKLFECYCDLLGAKVSYISLSTPSYHRLAQGFLGALQGTDFVNNSRLSRRSFIRAFVEAHNAIRAEIPDMEELKVDPDSMASNVSVWQAQRSSLDEESLRYWNGWGITSQKGREEFLNLPCLWVSHGKEFTEEFFRHWHLHSKKYARPPHAVLNKMAKYLSEHSEDWPSVTFQHPRMIKAFFLAFMKDFFLTAHKQKKNINSQIRSWNSFTTKCEEIFIETGVWAMPFQGGLPKPIPRPDLGIGTHKTMRENGVIVHEKLITPVPLHVTDQEAIEIIFRTIESDISIVKLWATEQCRKLWSRVQRRKALAKVGEKILGRGSEKSVEQLGLENICATFEQDGFRTDTPYLTTRFGGGNRVDVGDLLGLPSSSKLFPYQCLLVIKHPEITPSFLLKFALFDDNGNYIGFIKTDTGAKLIGYKDRKGKARSEQVIELTCESQQWIEEIIEITAPLRKFLRKKGNPIWKELFISCGMGFAPPSSTRMPVWNRCRFENNPKLYEDLRLQFAPYDHLLSCELQQFLERLSLTTIRSSCGVEVYLRTKSVVEMSKALGHTRYNTELLKRYLPDAILAFFQSRWIRIFQRSFICEAMKDSPYLLEATDFASMNELHTFLKNHALKDIPSYLVNPENKPSPKQVESQKSHIYISIDVGIMTAMLSLEAAVKNPKKDQEVSGLAKYWADVSKAVSDEIERGSDPLLLEHLNTARLHCNPSQMEKIIYVTAA